MTYYAIFHFDRNILGTQIFYVLLFVCTFVFMYFYFYVLLFLHTFNFTYFSFTYLCFLCIFIFIFFKISIFYSLRPKVIVMFESHV